MKMRSHIPSFARLRLARPSRGQRRGAAIVEMAITLVVLCLLVFGFIDAALLFQDESMLANITRVAARSFSLGDDVSTATAKGFASQPNYDPTNPNASRFNPSNTPLSFSAATNYSSTGGSSQFMAVTSGTAPTNSLVQVTSTYNHTFLTRYLGVKSMTLSKTVVYQHE